MLPVGVLVALELRSGRPASPLVAKLALPFPMEAGGGATEPAVGRAAVELVGVSWPDGWVAVEPAPPAAELNRCDPLCGVDALGALLRDEERSDPSSRVTTPLLAVDERVDERSEGEWDKREAERRLGLLGGPVERPLPLLLPTDGLPPGAPPPLCCCVAGR